MLIEHSASTHRRSIPKWLWISGLILLAIVSAGIVVLATHWPFTQDAVRRALEEASGRPVQIRTFQASYFPPGCSAQDIRFLHRSHPEAQPVITVEKLEIRGSLTGMFTSPKRLALVRVAGMRIRIPPKSPDGSGQSKVLLNSGSGGKSLAISKIVADGALLEFLPREPEGHVFRLKVDKLLLRDVGSGQPMAYRTTLTNTKPPGVIRSEGTFGPWNPDDAGSTPTAGSYTYDDIDLGEFHGIAGTGKAHGKFEGPLREMHTEGSVQVENFRVDGSEHPVALATSFDATVNGTNGDVTLHPATAHFRRTVVEVRGSIAGHEGEKGKTATFDVRVPRGRIEDLLLLFSKGRPGMTGNVSLTSKFVWPPLPEKFVEKIRMDIDFGIRDGKFTSANTQDSIDRLSESAAGESKKEQDEDPGTVLGNLRGHVSLRQGTATIGDGAFEVPGASASIAGTYQLAGHRVDLAGTLDTRGSLSDTTSGFKALVAKMITPLFRKQHQVKIVPFRISGSYGDTSVTIDWKRTLAK